MFGDGGNLILEISHEVEGGRVWASDVGRRLQVEWVIGKVVDRYSGTVVRYSVLQRLEAVVGERGGCVCVMGGKLGDSGGEKVTHVGGWTKYIVLKEGVGLEEVQRMVTSNVLTVHKLWYSLKYDRGMVIELEGDGDLRMFLKGNDEHGYLYVGDNDGPKRRAQKAMWSYDHGIVCGRSDRDRDDMVQEGRKGAGLKRWRKCEH
ncbi:hypothetical protein Cgig2_023615 [Carnegiea gigantea]|uniref:Uncharacterized protein n=1 Tax=Carnegiea gigantea TaxID=171969 RepID=A0A9Q1KEH6_9CARY|nr:hypothetical protein Cgig2_023615 [Carnegiea gigantea]